MGPSGSWGGIGAKGWVGTGTGICGWVNGMWLGYNGCSCGERMGVWMGVLEWIGLG